MTKAFYFLFSFTIFVSCSLHKEKKALSIITPKEALAKGFTAPNDSLKKPRVIIVDESKLRKVLAGKPSIIYTSSNIHETKHLQKVLAGTPRICVPGQDSILFPKEVLAIDSPFVAGTPEIVLAKDPFVKDQNPESFSTYDKLQGLKNSQTRSLLQDRFGNLWIGSYGGGVSKFDGKYFTHYTKKEGLCNNYIFSMLEDRSGNLWFVSDGGGVSRFDGKYFTSFTEKEGLCNNYGLCIFQDDKGNVWFGTDNGVSKYDGKHFINFSQREGLCMNNVISIFQDKEGNIWFGTDGAGVSKYDGVKFTNFSKKEGLCGNNVICIQQDKVGNIWFGTDGDGVSEYDGKYFTQYTQDNGLCSNSVMSIIQDKRGDIWFGTFGGGVCKLEAKGQRFIHFTEKEGLSNNYVFSILEDKTGNLWLGTNGGVSRYDGRIFNFITKKDGLINYRVNSIIQAKDKNLWIGSYDGGVSIYNGHSFTHYTDKEGLSDKSVFSILEDKSGNIWLGTDGGGVNKFDGKYFTHYTDNDGLSNNRIMSIIQDRKGNIWFGTYGGGVDKYDGKKITQYTSSEGLSNNYVLSILEDKKGDIWIGTDDGGVNRFDGSTFTQYTERQGLSNNNIFSMFEDSGGNIWFGTDGGGACKYDGEKFTHYTEREGLSNNYVMSIINDKQGNIWFGTRFGLSKLIENNVSTSCDDTRGKIYFKTYTYDDGFLGINCYRNSICRDDSGVIWIGSNESLTAFHPDRDEADYISPNIQLTGIDLFNEKINWSGLIVQNSLHIKRTGSIAKDTSFLLGNGVKVWGFQLDSLSKWYHIPQNLKLTYNNNYLTFNFIGITLKQSKKVKYQYKLEGIDENWSALTSISSVPYGNIPPGSYTFRVKAMNCEGLWSNEYNYKFTILPPWWETWWFRVIEVLFLVFTIFFYIKRRERKLKKDKLLLQAKVNEQTQELREKNKELYQQNEEIIAQRDEIEAQRDIVISQKNLIENKNKSITDSIRYAKHIQNAILPSDEKLEKQLVDYFILYQPKDIVSGDFYWVENITNEKNELITLIAAVDCTGHGVPGAFMSLLGYNGLSQAVKENRLTKPSAILDFLSDYIRETLRKRQEKNIVYDGMDLFMCSLNRETMQLEYAGVHNPAFLIRKGEIITLKPNIHPIGDYFTHDFNGYSNNSIYLEKGDVIYLFTDGYVDQFGGVNHKKFTSKKFKDVLLDIYMLDAKEQYNILNDKIEEWKGSNDQYDDILVMGIKL